MCSGHGRVVFRYFVLELVFLCPNILQASIKVIFELYKVILKPFFLKKKKKKKKRWNITDPSSSRKDGVVSLYPDPPTYN